MHGGRTGGAGVLHPGGRLETEIGGGLEHQGGGKILWREARVEVPEHDLVNIGGRDAGVIERTGGGANDQAFHRLAFEPAEWRVGPADDARGHLPNLRSQFSIAEFSALFCAY